MLINGVHFIQPRLHNFGLQTISIIVTFESVKIESGICVCCYSAYYGGVVIGTPSFLLTFAKTSLRNYFQRWLAFLYRQLHLKSNIFLIICAQFLVKHAVRIAYNIPLFLIQKIRVNLYTFIFVNLLKGY